MIKYCAGFFRIALKNDRASTMTVSPAKYPLWAY